MWRNLYCGICVYIFNIFIYRCFRLVWIVKYLDMWRVTQKHWCVVSLNVTFVICRCLCYWYIVIQWSYGDFSRYRRWSFECDINMFTGYRRAVHSDGEREVHFGAAWVYLLAGRRAFLLLLLEAYGVQGARQAHGGEAGGVRRWAQPRATLPRPLRQRRLRPAAASEQPSPDSPLPYYLSPRLLPRPPRAQFPPDHAQNRPLASPAHGRC